MFLTVQPFINLDCSETLEKLCAIAIEYVDQEHRIIIIKRKKSVFVFCAVLF